jgi:type IV pilus assembly protein PilM
MKILKKDSSKKKDDTKKKVSMSKNKGSGITSRTLIGVDITDHQIKTVALSGRGLSSLTLEKYAITPLEANVINDGKINDEEKLVASLQQNLKTLHTANKGFIAAMPEVLSTIQTFMCASEDANDLEEIAEFEVNQIADIDEINYDFQPIDDIHHSGNKKGDQEILLALTRKEDLEPRLYCLEEAKMTPLLYMDIDTFASINAFSHWINTQQPELSNEIIAICDIGTTNTHIMIVKNGQTIFKQQADMGSRYLEQAIQRQYQVGTDEAIKIKLDSNKPQGYKDVEDHFNEQVASTVQRAFQFYKTMDIGSGPEANVKQIVLTGGSSKITNLNNAIEALCNTPTQVVNPVEFLNQSKHINGKQLTHDAPMLNVAFGLCLRGFND